MSGKIMNLTEKNELLYMYRNLKKRNTRMKKEKKCSV